MKHEESVVATPSQTVGPFFHLALKALPNGGMGAMYLGGERIRLRVMVSDADGRPVDDALVEVWHVGLTSGDAFGRMPTDKDGACEFHIVRPQRRTDGHGQAAHVNICLFARGLLRQLHTRVYFDGDPELADDAVLALVPRDRRETLLARPDPQDGGRWLFHVRLQGTQETVFFDP